MNNFDEEQKENEELFKNYLKNAITEMQEWKAEKEKEPNSPPPFIYNHEIYVTLELHLKLHIAEKLLELLRKIE